MLKQRVRIRVRVRDRVRERNRVRVRLYRNFVLIKVLVYLRLGIKSANPGVYQKFYKHTLLFFF